MDQNPQDQLATLPRISVVTPSFNQGRFIEETLRSVLDQKYPNLEYLVIDGGSTDETVAILRRYESRLAYWVSEKDNGQAHAINKGFLRATGDIVAWLNSDDLYAPGALHAVATAFQTQPDARWLIGNVINFDTNRPDEGAVSPFVYHRDLAHWVTVEANPHQPGIFWKRHLVLENGPLREDWHYCFDAEFWCRLVARGILPVQLDKVLARFRLHPASKTCAQQANFFIENLRLAESLYPQIPVADRPLVDRYMTYLRFALAKIQADAYAVDGQPGLAWRSLWQALASDRKLRRQKSLYLKMVTAPLIGVRNRWGRSNA
jgi:glycosyltransferase involved in cell wall biosynthesis